MFKKYQSLTNTKSKYLQHYLDTYGDKPAHVLEKVHGANYMCSYDGTGFTFGRRKGQLGAKEDFYGDLSIRSVFADRVKHMYALIKEQTLAQDQAAHNGFQTLMEQGKPEEARKFYEETKPSVSPTFKSLRVRGELYGGYYNHPDVAKLHNTPKVGKGGISYAQNASIAVFQVEIDDVPLPWIQAKLLCFASDLPTVPCVFNGSFEDCIKFSQENIHGPTLIPNGTPELDAKGNVVLIQGQPHALPPIHGNEREGHVIVFQEPLFLSDGRQVVFKDINPNHAETAKSPARVPMPVEFTESEQYVFDKVSAGFTEERMVTQFSYETYTRRDMASVMGKVISDTIGETRQENDAVDAWFETMSAKDRKLVTKELTRAAYLALKDKFMELCDD